jgi:threonine/homoserine/homoserine lactone efflux protein
MGVRHLFGRASALNSPDGQSSNSVVIVPFRLYREAFLLAAMNPKPILFFTALFPQFISTQAPLLPQFLLLTGIFMALSFLTLVSYALLAIRARPLLLKPLFAKWINRAVGVAFISFGAALLALRRPTS